MNATLRRTVWMTVVALVASLGTVVISAPIVDVGCGNAQTYRAAAKCCCGSHCRCPNCGSHRQPSNDKRQAPATPISVHDLTTIGAGLAHFGAPLTNDGPAPNPVTSSVAEATLQTLVAKHSCLRV